MGATTLTAISRQLSKKVSKLTFLPPVACVYNPLVYARAPHEAYLERYGSGRGGVVLLGMNPGPFGMAQTGVPFGDVSMVRDWLGLEGRVDVPEPQHEKRPILGFACKRSEVSGSRLWGWARQRFETPARFFERFFVINYCPLVFMEASGKNLTPDKLPAAERAPLFAACDEAVRRAVDILEPHHVVGIGGFAEARARSALEGYDVTISTMLHPSPANPSANKAWAATIERQLREAGVSLP
jgi:single-strand selective monofunctional uracil DNA glycosylase